MGNQEDRELTLIMWYLSCGILSLIIIILMATPQGLHEFLSTSPGYSRAPLPLASFMFAMIIILFWPFFYIIALFGLFLVHLLPVNQIVKGLVLCLIITPFISWILVVYSKKLLFNSSIW
ncbi:MAG: hypothetical protein JSV04_10800 [Candidatus Heimdallarchaeota archaeon]|nr:MAG: hypothetical protein JSV04_10800 [Candidatus Heimdallarchaeota archaeon]